MTRGTSCRDKDDNEIGAERRTRTTITRRAIASEEQRRQRQEELTAEREQRETKTTMTKGASCREGAKRGTKTTNDKTK